LIFTRLFDQSITGLVERMGNIDHSHWVRHGDIKPRAFLQVCERLAQAKRRQGAFQPFEVKGMGIHAEYFDKLRWGRQSGGMSGRCGVKMKIIGLAGWSGAGKTTLIKRLLPALVARGYSVSTVKHAHHRFDIDYPGKDSHAHREAGAKEVLIVSGERFALMHELRGEAEPDLKRLLSLMTPVDFVIVEGFKSAAYPKIEIHRAENGKDYLYPSDERILAVASDQPERIKERVSLDLADVDAIAAFVIAHAAPLSEVPESLNADQGAHSVSRRV